MSGAKASGPPKPWRGRLVLALLLAGVGAIGWRLVTLHIHQRDFLQGQGDARTVRAEPLAAHRGRITDRNGEPLAVSAPVSSIWVDPSRLAGGDEAVRRLAGALGLDGDRLAGRVRAAAGREFLYVKRHLAPSDAERALALGIEHVHARREYRRFYPQGEIAAHLVGFSDIDGAGQEGLELAYDEWLRGVPGRRRVMKDRRGRIIRELGVVRSAQPGKDLALSIDFRLQDVAYRALKAGFVARRARAASAVALDAGTGEVLAMVNQPSYNPNNRSDMADFGALRNRAVTDVFEPGSTVKAFTAAAALETGLYAPDSVIDTSPGWMMIGGNEVRDLSDYGELTLERVVARSSNIGTSKIALAIGPEPIRAVLERVGFGRSAGSGFPGERGGVLPAPARWSPIEAATLSFGYGLSGSALQLARAYAVLADGGVAKPVSLLRLDAGAVDRLPRERALDPRINAQVLAMLEAAADPARGGSAGAGAPFHRVAGKSGTAHVVGESGYEENLHNSLFVGLAPASDPRVVAAVVINEPKGDEHYGGQVAAPVFSEIMAAALRILNVAPDRDFPGAAPAGARP